MIELNTIQTKLNAPKGKKNKFGGFDYRSLEDICEAVKPLLKETECTLTFSDDLMPVEGRIFIRSVATIKNKSGEYETATAFAELGEHKGMSSEQMTGSASSYARKYAACSLLAIDDNTDPDSIEEQPVEARPARRRERVAQKPGREEAAAPAETEKKMKKVHVTMADEQKIASISAWMFANRGSWLDYMNMAKAKGVYVDIDLDVRRKLEADVESVIKEA